MMEDKVGKGAESESGKNRRVHGGGKSTVSSPGTDLNVRRGCWIFTRALLPLIAMILERFGEELAWRTASKVSGPKSSAFLLYLLIHGG